jgi:RNA polymerase sigma-70 factor (ECF subfamily)
MRRVLMDRLRADYSAAVTAALEEHDIAAPDLDTGLEENLDVLHDELKRLSGTEREILTLFYLRELSLGEIAELISAPIGTVKSRLFRARASLRSEIDKRRTQ